MTSKRRKLYFISGMIIFVLLIFTLVGGVYFLSRNSGLTQAQKDEIYANIIKNNSSALLTESQNAGSSIAALDSRTTSTNADTALTAPALIFPNQDSSKYSYFKSTTINGPAVGSCKLYENAAGKYENYSYRNDDETYHNKNIAYNSDGSIQTYYLTNNEGGTATTYEYRGGSFAIKTTSTQNKIGATTLKTNESGVDAVLDAPISGPVIEPSPTPTPEPQQPQPQVDPMEAVRANIRQYFGGDADISRVANENGKTYYVITATSDSYCDQPNYYLTTARDAVSPDYQLGESKKIAFEHFINSANFQIEKTKAYINSISDANLMNTVTSEATQSNDSYEKFANNFKFEFNVPVKEIVYDYTKSVQKEKQAVKTYLSTQNFTLLFPDGLRLDSVYSFKITLDEYTQYYKDRNFYGPGATGDKAYTEVTTVEANQDPWYDQPLLNLTFNNGDYTNYKNAGIFIHDKSKDKDTLIKNYLGSFDGSTLTSTNTTLKIDGQNVAAVKYTQTYNRAGASTNGSTGTAEPSKGGGSAPSDQGIVPPCGPECSGTYSVSYYYLDFKGYQYIISINEILESDLKFTTKSSVTDKSTIDPLIDSMFERRGEVEQLVKPL